LTPNPRQGVLVAVGVTLATRALQAAPRFAPPWADVLVWSIASVALCATALRLSHRLRPRAILDELGLLGTPVPAIALVAVASTAPALVLLMSRANPELPAASTLLPLALFGPLGEEIVFRGYLFQQLHRRARWGFWPAAGLSALLFGLAHVHGLTRTLEAPSNVVVPAIGGFFFAWLFLRWKENLWVPIAVHASMNFWWEVLHSTGDLAAGQHAQLARGVFVGIVILKTLRETPAFDSEPASIPE